GANRLGASALMQGLADGYFGIPYTLGDYIASEKPSQITTDAPEFAETEKQVKAKVARLLDIGSKGKKTVMEFYRELGKLTWDKIGMARTEAGLKEALEKIPKIKEE